MTSGAEFEMEIQRRLADEFSRRGWEYDLQSGRLIARRISTSGVVNVDELALLANLSKLARVPPTRGSLASAIGKALKNLRIDQPRSIAMMRILFVAAGPADEATLRLDAEHRDIQGRIRASTNRERVVLETLLAARPRDLIDALNRFKPTVLHISGHASSATGIALEDDDGLAVDLSGDQLLRLISVSDPTLRLVVLNSCESATHAQPLVAHVDAAIGMLRSVNDEAALEFAAQLYSSLAEGVSVGRAMEQACLQLNLTGLPEDHQPTLYSSPSGDVASMTLT